MPEQRVDRVVPDLLARQGGMAASRDRSAMQGYQQRLTQLTASLTTTQQQLAAANATAQQMSTALATANTKVTSLTTDLTASRQACAAQATALTALTQRVAALEARKAQLRHDLRYLDPLDITTTGKDYPLTWSAPMPTPTYDVDPRLSSTAAVLALISATVKPGTQTATGVTITVKRTGLLAVGVSILLDTTAITLA